MEIGWIGCAIYQANPKRLTDLFFFFNILILNYFFKYETIETHACAFLTLIILGIATVVGHKRSQIWLLRDLLIVP
jgi:hypothetical protein